MINRDHFDFPLGRTLCTYVANQAIPKQVAMLPTRDCLLLPKSTLLASLSTQHNIITTTTAPTMTGSPSNIPTGPKRPGHGRSNLGRAGGRSGGSSERGEASGAAAAVAGMKRKASIDTLREAVTAERPPPSSPETAARRDTVQQRRQSAEAVLAVWGQPLVSPEEHVRVPKSSADCKAKSLSSCQAITNVV
jgi:hypothetical protein